MTEDRLTENLGKAADVMSHALLFLGILMLSGKREWWPSFYMPVFFGVTFLVSAVLAYSAKFLLKTEDACKNEAGVWLRFSIATALMLNALGELYLYQLYKYGFQYDKLIHFANSSLFVVVLAGFFRVWRKHHPAKALLYAVVAVSIASISWEIMEYLSDYFFKTEEFGIYGQLKAYDTILDLLSDFSGIAISAIMLNPGRSDDKALFDYCHKIK